MSKLYLPTEYLSSPCKVVNNGYIRVYTNTNLTQYVDVYYNNNYMEKLGGNNYAYTGECDKINVYTDDYYYRTDFPDILIMFCIICFFGFFIPFKIFSKLFKKGSI